MMPIALIVLGLAALAYFRPDLFGAILAPDTGAGSGAPFPSPSSDTPSTPPTLSPALPDNIAAIVALVLELAGDQDPALLLGVIEKESRFDPGAVNMQDPHGGSWGLLQMAAATAADMGVADPRALLDPPVAIATGVRYLDWIDGYLRSHGGGGLNQKIAAWNEGAAAAVSGLPDYPYVAAVAANMTKWRAWLDGAAVA